MAGRVDALSSGLATGARAVVTGEAVRGALDPGVVDRAMQVVLRSVPVERHEQLKALWMSDTDNPVTRALQSASVARQFDSMRRVVGARRTVVDYRLNAQQIEFLVNSYPDRDLVFQGRRVHDHPMGAVTRKMDEEDLLARLPPRVSVADFGGNVVSHVERAHEHVVSVVATVDQHDGGRRKLSDMRVATIARGLESGLGPTAVSMARSVEAGETKYVAREKLQEFSRRVDVGMFVHVYDVPIEDIAAAMDRCGMRVFVGVMHLSSQFFERDAGLLETIGARFEIDRAADRFRMGFLGSHAKWYTHTLSGLLKYGVDQVLTGRRNYYSYKIVKRRGDTLEFRVLPVGPLVVREMHQVYRVPGVRAVVVDGYKLGMGSETRAVGAGAKRLLPESYVYPEATWERMVRAATVEATRGTLNYNTMVSEYRTQIAGLKYNGVSVGESSVDPRGVGVFVALAAVYGCYESMMMRRMAGTFAASEARKREDETSSTAALALQAVFAGAASVVSAPLWPLAALADWLLADSATLLYKLVRVREVVSVRRVPADSVVQGRLTAASVAEMAASDRKSDGGDDYPELFRSEFGGAYDDMLGYDAVEAACLALEAEALRSGEVVVDEFEGVVAASTTAVASERADPGSKPDWLPMSAQFGAHTEVYSRHKDAHGATERQAAVVDAAQACLEEMRAVNADVSTAYQTAMVGGKPDVRVLRDNKERWFDADMWKVEKGVVAGDSVLGKPAADFQYQAVYCPVLRSYDVLGKMGYVGLHVVSERVSQWTDMQGLEREREYRVMEIEYDGYVMTNKRTVIYNGPEIVTALLEASRLSMAFEGGTRRGGPGAGKTHLIRHNIKPGDYFVSPLRKSVEDFRGKMVKDAGWSTSHVRKVFRTVDSVLVAFARGDSVHVVRARFGHPSVLWTDEVYATLPGRVYAVCALLGVTLVVALGDDLQVPPGVRATYMPLMTKVVFPHDVFSYIVWRSCPEVLATFNGHYGNRLRTVAKHEGVCRVGRIAALTEVDFTGKEVAVLGMYQADKPRIRKMLPQNIHQARSWFVSTTHEGQGTDVDVVVLLDLDPRRRSDAYGLYDDPAYVTVAFSRAKKELYLLKVGDGENLATRWLGRASDARHVKSSADVVTAGQDYTTLPGWVA